MRSQSHDTYTWTIREIIYEAPSVYSLILESKEDRPHFIAGQYLTVRISDFQPTEGKSYSISSRTQEQYIRLTVKEMGLFSKAILSHKVGDTLTTSAPYGFFYPEHDAERDLVFIAGGIGITPNISIIETLLYEKTSRNISLFYSNRTVKDIIFKHELDALQTSFPALNITYHITQEVVSVPSFIQGRMNASTILSNFPEWNTVEFFICGSIDFTKGLWSELRKANVTSAQIYTEGFF